MGLENETKDCECEFPLAVEEYDQSGNEHTYTCSSCGGKFNDYWLKTPELRKERMERIEKEKLKREYYNNSELNNCPIMWRHLG